MRAVLLASATAATLGYERSAKRTTHWLIRSSLGFAVRNAERAPWTCPRNRVKILYWERNGFCLWLKRLESERFKTSPDESDEAIVLSVQELNWLLDGFDLWRNRPHQVLTPRFVA